MALRAVRHSSPETDDMTFITTLLVVLVAIALALVLAFLPLRAAVAVMARNIAAPIREMIQRQRERRAEPRPTPDRRRVL